MKLFITGSNGYIARNFIKKAIKRNHKIFAVTRKKNNKKIKNIKWLVGSIDKKWKDLYKADIVIHFATVGAYDKYTNFSETIDFKIFKSLALMNKDVSIINSSNLFFKNLFSELGIFLIEK